MADLSSMIAQFGQNAGSGIAAGVQRGLQRGERNRLLDLQQQASKDEAEQKRKAEFLKGQSEYTVRGIEALASATPENRPLVWQGFLQGAAERGYDTNGEPTEWDERYLPVLMGKAGIKAPGVSDAPTSIQDRNALFAIVEDEGAPDWKRRAARIELGLDPRAVGSSKITIAEDGKTDLVAGSEATISGATAGASEQAKIDTRVDNGDRLAELDSKRARATANAKDSTDRASAAFDQVSEISKSIGLYDEAIAAIDEGAETGRALKFLPSFSESTNKFENAANQLGLSIIGQTTFGALSAAELNMALETAVPDGMRPEALRRWLTDKKTAQIKLANELRKLGTFLQRGGKISEWYAMQEQEPQPTIDLPAPQAATEQAASTSGFKILSVEQ